MKIGIYTDARNPPNWQRPWSQYYGELAETVEEAENLGIDELWLSEHHGFEDGYLPQPMMLAASLAARTTKIGFATAIVLAPLRPAIELAEQAAMVDVISSGRFQLGLGAGYRDAEFEAFGVPINRRFKLLEARLEEVRAIWEAGEILPPPHQERLPLWVGGLGPRAAKMAARLGEGYLWLRPDCVEAYLSAWAEAGRDPETARVSGLANLIISDDPERDWPRIAPHLSYMWGTYARYANDAPEPTNADRTALTSSEGVLNSMSEDVEADSLRSKGPVMLPPDFDVVEPAEAVRRLTAWLGEMPVESVYFWLSIAGMPDDLIRNHVELLANQVRPALAPLGIPAP